MARTKNNATISIIGWIILGIVTGFVYWGVGNRLISFIVDILLPSSNSANGVPGTAPRVVWVFLSAVLLLVAYFISRWMSNKFLAKAFLWSMIIGFVLNVFGALVGG